ncbi:hypothetical protein [Sphingobium sp.]|uniref:hypothetical protein n=1 Tax=Sphingobium sp. TaxID=1912891 RepID=UPI002617DA9A|nr:hypothetical protein [Sphingobium sp.]
MDQTPPIIRLARSGTFTSNEGVAVSFNEAMFAATAAAYDRDGDPAPLVIGHPKLDDPAFGWVESLAVENGELVARPADVEPAFAEAVRKKRYSKVSARFYPPEHPANPKPGVWYLKHIGFLGAHAPGIKGLGTVQFADGADEGAATFDFSESEDNTMSEASFAERASALDERERAVEAREEQARKDALAALHAGNVSFAEGLIAQAKLAPAGKQLLIGVLDHLDASAVVSFGEAGEMPPAAALKKLFDGAVPLVSFGEHGKKPKDDKSYISFAAPEGYNVDPEQAELHSRATALQQANPTMSWIDAVKRAQAGG